MIGYLVCIAVGVVFIVIGIKQMRKFDELRRFGIRTEARIVEIIEKRSGPDVFHYPVFEFETKQKQLIRKESDAGTSGGSYVKGQQVEVLYIEEDPKSASIYNKFLLIMFPRIFIVLGMIALILGFLMAFELVPTV